MNEATTEPTTAAWLSAADRQRLLDEFVDATFACTAPQTNESCWAAEMRSSAPQFPETPSADQMAPWVQLAELARDPDFRVRARQLIDAADDRSHTPDDQQVERYCQPLTVLHGRAPHPTTTSQAEWLTPALRRRLTMLI